MISKIARVLQQIHGGDLVEIRAIGVPVHGRRATWSGYFDDYKLAEKAALECEKAQAAGIYITLNTIHRGLIARSPNILEKQPQQSTTDSEVIKHRWLLVDVDPKRPSGISSTAKELELAKSVREDIASWLVQTFPQHTLIRACSGNGYHALLQIDLDANEKKDVLKLIDSLFGRDEIEIDQSVTKPAQLTKLYGTWARKGYDMPDRPHRRSFIELVTEAKEKK